MQVKADRVRVRVRIWVRVGVGKLIKVDEDPADARRIDGS